MSTQYTYTYIYIITPHTPNHLQQTFIPPRMHRIPFRTAKLNEVGVTEYYGGWPHGKRLLMFVYYYSFYSFFVHYSSLFFFILLLCILLLLLLLSLLLLLLLCVFDWLYYIGHVWWLFLHHFNIYFYQLINQSFNQSMNESMNHWMNGMNVLFFLFDPKYIYNAKKAQNCLPLGKSFEPEKRIVVIVEK